MIPLGHGVGGVLTVWWPTLPASPLPPTDEDRSVVDSLPGDGDGDAAAYRIVLRDLVISLAIGVPDQERQRPQRVAVSLDLTVRHPGPGFRDEIVAVLSYHGLVEAIRGLTGPVKLLETLAERIAALCLADARVLAVEVRVEKPDVYPDAAAVGVIITRRR
jgi:dihydroneopterin aldolase